MHVQRMWAIARLEERPTNRDFKKARMHPGNCNALTCFQPVLVVVAAARALRHLSAGDLASSRSLYSTVDEGCTRLSQSLQA